MKLGGKAALGAFWTGLSNILVSFFAFAGQLVLARFLFPRDFGAFAFALSIFELLSILIEWNFSLGLIQLENKPKLSDTAFVLSICQGGIFVLVAAIVSFLIKRYALQTPELPLVFILLSFGYALTPISNLYSAQLEKKINLKSLSIWNICVSFTASLLSVVFAILGFGIWSLVARELLSVLLTLLGYRSISNKRFHWVFHKPSAGKLIGFGRKIFMAGGLERVLNRVDYFIAGFYAGMGTLGYYSQARFMVNAAAACVSPALFVAFPLYAVVQTDQTQLRQAYRIISFFIVRCMIPFCIVFFTFPEDLISVLFGERWRSAGAALRWLAFYPIVVPEYENMKNLFYGIGKIAAAAWIRALQLFLAVLLVTLGWKIHGVEGASIGYMISMVVGWLAFHIAGARYAAGTLKENFLIPIAAGTVVFILENAFQQTVFPRLDTVRMIELLGATALFYFTILLAFEYKLIARTIYVVMDGFRNAPSDVCRLTGNEEKYDKNA